MFRDLLRQRAGGHRESPRGLTPLGIDLDDAGGHVAVFHGGHTCDDLHGLHVGRGDVVGRDAGHAREGGVVRKPDAVHLDDVLIGIGPLAQSRRIAVQTHPALADQLFRFPAGYAMPQIRFA